MLSLATLAHRSYVERAAITALAVSAAGQIWRGLDPGDLQGSWRDSRAGDRLLEVTTDAQLSSVASASTYARASLAAQGYDGLPDGVVNPAALAGVASDGRDLGQLLHTPLITSHIAAVGGASLSAAFSRGLMSLTRIVATQVEDAGRVASGVEIASRPSVGYTRVVNPGACSRCVVLAGRFYEWNDGFLRHPLCACEHLPDAETGRLAPGATDPMEHFNSLSEAEQDRAFTRAGAQAIRDGADISRVVNARRGALGLSTASSQTAYTTTGAKGYSRKGKRLMPEAIYDIAGDDRDHAVRLLKTYGFLTT